MILNEQQIFDFEKNGFLKIQGAIDSSELQNLQVEFENSKDSIKSYSKWAYMGIFRHSPMYRSFIQSSGAAAIAKQLLQYDRIDLYWDSVTIKAANSPKEFTWHQDEGFTATNPQGYVTFWIPLQDVDQKNGGLWILPGSHKCGALSHNKVPASETTVAGREIQDLDFSTAVEVKMKKGELLVFSSLLAHKSGGNFSNNDRLALAFAIHKHGYKEINVPESLSLVPGLEIT